MCFQKHCEKGKMWGHEWLNEFNWWTHIWSCWIRGWKKVSSLESTRYRIRVLSTRICVRQCWDLVLVPSMNRVPHLSWHCFIQTGFIATIQRNENREEEKNIFCIAFTKNSYTNKYTQGETLNKETTNRITIYMER